jgi:hypothetical protein
VSVTLQSELAAYRQEMEAREEAHRQEIAAREEAHRQEAARWRMDFANYIQSIQIPGAVMPPLPASMFAPPSPATMGTPVSIYVCPLFSLVRLSCRY